MRHELSLEGPALRLRPVRDADAEFIVALRSNPELNRYLHAGAVTTAQQQAWLAHYYARAGDYYFVLEQRDGGRPEGLIAIYDIEPAGAVAEWGRWILRPQSLAAIESAWLIYRCAFEQLALNELFCRTVADNQAVVSFHDSCGIERRRLLPAHFQLHERSLDAVEHRVLRADWPALSPRLERLATLTARRLCRG